MGPWGRRPGLALLAFPFVPLAPARAQAPQCSAATLGSTTLLSGTLKIIAVVLTTTADATGTTQLRLPAVIRPGVYVVRGGAPATRLVVE